MSSDDHNVEIDKNSIIVETQGKLIKYKDEFSVFHDLFNHINASLFEITDDVNIEKDLTKYFHDQIIDLLNKKEQFNSFCQNLKDIQIIDDLSKCTVIPLTSVPIVELEMNSIIKVVSDIMILIREIRKQIHNHNKKAKRYDNVLSYYS
ncbi:MAG: hypothetical protein Barrevirus35_2 [Barrevirus sp.]|uniref:Uncharacterized protein n=1 Tax=Barrevirus sp. TaxID=2487763 RepID=A0A3G4ZUP5_9VIRU|nr:MAG: hypothetical protein Barrevirus35_2 [Barrevirus sp.]